MNTPGRAGTPRPGLVAASQPQQASQPVQRGHTPIGVGTPRSHPASAAPATTGPSMPSARHTPIPTPAPTPGAGAPANATRGLKREREESVGQMNGGGPGQAQTPGVTVVTNGWSKPAATVVNAKAGNAGVRPRPIKKQRVVCALVANCSLGGEKTDPTVAGHAGAGAGDACAAADAARVTHAPQRDRCCPQPQWWASCSAQSLTGTLSATSNLSAKYARSSLHQRYTIPSHAFH